VILAGVLAMDSRLLLLDEPTAELDPAGAALVWRLVRDLARAAGKSVLVATSDLDAIPEFATHVVSALICETPAPCVGMRLGVVDFFSLEREWR